jgi:alpha-tubulin suppressor-like RCC1 family protein
MSTTKYKLEYSYPNETGNNASDKLVDTNLITNHKTIEFTSQHVVAVSDNRILIDWDNGNFQKSTIGQGNTNTWVQLENPGIFGRYELLLMKSVAGTGKLTFGDYTWNYTNIDWLNGYPDFPRVSVNSGLIITFRWNGYRYSANVGYLENNEAMVAAGESHSFYILKNIPNYVRVWGNNSNGMLGDGNISECSIHPTIPKHNRIFNYINSKYYHSLGIDYQGKVWAWGNNSSGQLGDNTVTLKSTPVAVCGNYTFCKISSGFEHSLGIDHKGQVWGWGYNFYGGLGDNDTTNKCTPVSIHGTKKTFCHISVGYLYSMAIDYAGKLWGWGYGYSGQLGIGSGYGICESTPTAISGINKTFCNVSAGYLHSLGVDYTGQTWAWGWNGDGQLGDSTFTSRATPVTVYGLHTFCHIVASIKHSLGLDKNGKLWSWGNNGNGQLGINTRVDQNIPVSVHGNHTFCYVSAGLDFSMGVDHKARVWSWGLNTRGQLGINSIVPRCTPTRACYI